MMRMFGMGGAACPRCERKHGAQDGYCGGCGLLLGAPRHAPVLVENRWMPGADELAVFFGVRALSGLFVKTLRVPATSRAFILQGGAATEVPQGEYEIEGFFTRLNHLLRDQHAEILVTRSGPLAVEFSLSGLASAEHLQVDARLSLLLRVENVPAFARHFMTLPGTVGAAQLRELLQEPLRQVALDFTCARSLRDMAGKSELRSQFDQHLQGGLAPLLADYGLAVVRVDTLELRHDKYDAHRARIGTLWLAADERHVELAHARQLDELYDAEEMQRIAREEAHARQRHRRAELRQEESLAGAELSLTNAERAHALRTREIELYGRIVEAKTRKEALARGAADAVAELEQELRSKHLARLDEATEWQHLRELAGLRMRTEMEVAREDAAQARTVATQRFAHQLLQQQIRNKIEQARGIEDAVRQRAELARLHEEEGALAQRARAIADEEHAARLRLLQVEHAALLRETERVLEWQDAVASARLRERERAEALDAEAVQQKIARLRREGAGQDAIAQHEKLLRTIEADRAARAIDFDEREAERRHQIAHAQALGALDDATKLVLAPAANAGLLAEVMKAHLHADMGADQLAALAQVTYAVQSPGVEAVRAAHQQLDQVREQERVRREQELDKDRRHQLDLLALQNDVNKTALESQARLGAAVAAGAGAVCAHTGAAPSDRYCAACGAALPARG
ncbi:hypothetical protein [Massilia sp. 9096]|uniref:hypothetical protein n=1 Tax=Massilia sp. 9096 TaxID=1500894 RepID=UPI00055DE42C|nr:hypothetical protein [Massilia sp. 9096]